MTLKQIQTANPEFFSTTNKSLFGDKKYEIQDNFLVVHYERETSDHRTVQEFHTYAVDPETLQLYSVFTHNKTQELYIFKDIKNRQNKTIRQILDDTGLPIRTDFNLY